MAKPPTPSVPTALARAGRRFETWRRTRTKPRIPESLWKLAAELGRRYGVNQTAKALRLDYYDLKRRVEAGPARTGARGRRRAFVEIRPAAAAAPAVSACRVEIEDGRGATMRIDLAGAGSAELAALGRLFWRQEA